MDTPKPNPTDPDDVDPLAYLQHVKPQPQPEAVDVATLDVSTLLRTTRVLFYPACEFDWRPVLHFTALSPRTYWLSKFAIEPSIVTAAFRRRQICRATS